MCTSTHKEEEGGGSRIQNKITMLKIDTNTNCKTKHKKHSEFCRVQIFVVVVVAEMTLLSVTVAEEKMIQMTLLLQT